MEQKVGSDPRRRPCFVGRRDPGTPDRVPSALVGTEKRERQKTARQAKIEELRAVEHKQASKRRGTMVGLGVVGFVAFVIIFSVVTSDSGDKDVASGDDDSAVDEPIDDGTDDSTTTTEASEAVQVKGTPPTTAPTRDPVDPECPETDGSSEPTYDFTGSFENCLEDGIDYQARFVTTKGDVLVDLREEEMPNTVNNFVALARYHYYDNGDLFRTDPSIDIIQGGGPHTQNNGDPGPGYTIDDEPADAFDEGKGPFTYEPGQLIMANTGRPDSSGAQFFFSTGPNVSLLDSQGTYLLFGDVIEGLDILQEIIALHFEDGVTLGGRPTEYVIVERVEIIEA